MKITRCAAGNLLKIALLIFVVCLISALFVVSSVTFAEENSFGTSAEGEEYSYPGNAEPGSTPAGGSALTRETVISLENGVLAPGSYYLGEDITDLPYTEQIVINGEVTLDLNGFRLSGEAANGVIRIDGAAASLTLKDSIGGGKLFSEGHNPIVLTNGGKFIFESGYAESDISVICVGTDDDEAAYGTIIVAGGTVSSSGRNAILVNGCTAVDETKRSSVTISDGFLNGKLDLAAGTELNISGGSFSSVFVDSATSLIGENREFARLTATEEGYNADFPYKAADSSDIAATVEYIDRTDSFLSAEAAFTYANELETSSESPAAVTLSKDAESAALTVNAGSSIILDLNGKILLHTGEGSASVVTVNGNFTLQDSGTGSHDYYKSENGAYMFDGNVAAEGSISGGVLSGGNATLGGGVYVAEGGSFTLNGGTIAGNTSALGGGVYIEKGSFGMNGGDITGNTASSAGGGIYVTMGTSFEMSGGTITDNTANNGGGIYVNYTDFVMTGGEISHNAATTEGGGVYVTNSAKFNFSGAESVISENTAVQGGGIYCSASELIIAGGNISSNTAQNHGGGIYIYNYGMLELKEDGTISYNTADNGYYGGGVYVTNGTFTMNGGKIIGNTGDRGAGVYIVNNAEFTMTGGVIGGENDADANIATGEGGGVYAEAAFNMSAGNIIGNQANHGGGIYISDSDCTISGGKLSDNTATDGSAIYMYGDYEAECNLIEGGEIDGEIYSYMGTLPISGGYIGSVRGATFGDFHITGGYFNIAPDEDYIDTTQYSVVQINADSGDNNYREGYPYAIYDKSEIPLSTTISISDISNPVYDGDYLAESEDFTVTATQGSENVTDKFKCSYRYIETSGQGLSANESGVGLPKNVGTYTVTVTLSEIAGAAEISESFSIVIGKADLHTSDFAIITPEAEDPFKPNYYTYSGQPVTVTAEPNIVTGVGEITVKYYLYDALTGEIPVDEAVEVGTYNIKLEVKEGANFKGGTLESDNWYFVITKAVLVPEKYPGTDLKATFGDSLSVVPLPECNNGVWEWEFGGAKIIDDVGELTFTAIFSDPLNSNYTEIEYKVTVNVSPYETAVVWEEYDFLYNGRNQKSYIKAYITEILFGMRVYLDIELSNGDEFKDYSEGGYIATASIPYGDYYADADCYILTDDTKVCNIIRPDISGAEITLAEEDFTYNGTEQIQVVSSFVCEEITVEEITYEISGDRGTNAGEYTLTVNGTGNFTGTVTAKWSIAKKSLQDGMFEITGSYTYNGGKIVPEYSFFDGAENNILSATDFSVTCGDNINAGEAAGSITFTATEEGNYSGSVTLTFDIAEIKVAVPVPASELVYNGKEQTGVADGDFYTVTGGKATDAGDYKATAVLSSEENYIWSDPTFDGYLYWSIGKAAVLRPEAPLTTFTYNGQEQSFVPNGFDAGLMTITENSYINANEDGYPVTVSLIDKHNYKWATGDENADITFRFVIQKAVATAPSAPEIDGSLIYGQSLSALNIPIGWEWTDAEIIPAVSDSQTTTYAVRLAVDAGNYDWSDVEGYSDGYYSALVTVTVEKASYDMSDVSFTGGTFIEDGSEKSIFISGTLPAGVSVTYIGNAESAYGVYIVTARFDGDFDNYNFIPEMTAEMVIKQASVSWSDEDSETPDVIVTEEGGSLPSVELVIEEKKQPSVDIDSAIAPTEKVFAVYDVELRSEGVGVLPSGKVTIKMAIPDALEGKQFRILHLSEGDFSEIEFTVEGSYAVFTAVSLDEFAFVAEDPGAAGDGGEETDDDDVTGGETDVEDPSGNDETSDDEDGEDKVNGEDAEADDKGEKGEALPVIIALSAVILIELLLIIIKKIAYSKGGGNKPNGKSNGKSDNKSGKGSDKSKKTATQPAKGAKTQQAKGGKPAGGDKSKAAKESNKTRALLAAGIFGTVSLPEIVVLAILGVAAIVLGIYTIYLYAPGKKAKSDAEKSTNNNSGTAHSGKAGTAKKGEKSEKVQKSDASSANTSTAALKKKTAAANERKTGKGVVKSSGTSKAKSVKK